MGKFDITRNVSKFKKGDIVRNTHSGLVAEWGTIYTGHNLPCNIGVPNEEDWELAVNETHPEDVMNELKALRKLLERLIALLFEAGGHTRDEHNPAIGHKFMAGEPPAKGYSHTVPLPPRNPQRVILRDE
jgi:hypothetical protein